VKLVRLIAKVLTLVTMLALGVGCLRGARSAGDAGPVAIEYVPIAIAWVRRHVPATEADVASWAKSPAGVQVAGAEVRHVLVAVPPRANARTVAAARGRAKAVVARVLGGEDFGEIARAESDDEATRDGGGALGRDPGALAQPVKRAALALGPGEMARDPIRSARGFHVVMRDPVDAAAVVAAYKRSRASQLARTLADEMLARMRASSDPLETIARESVTAILGEAAVEDEKRHPAVTLSREGAADADLPEDAKEGLAAFARKAQPGDLTDSALGTGPVLVVARAVAREGETK
jgi:hypothetical protein